MVIVKDKTIKSPVIQSRYTRSNCYVALWRAGESGLCKGWTGFCKHHKHSEKDKSFYPAQTRLLPGFKLQKGPGGNSSITDYCEPHKNWGCENFPLMSRLFQSDDSRSQWVYSQRDLCDFLLRIVWQCYLRDTGPLVCIKREVWLVCFMGHAWFERLKTW